MKSIEPDFDFNCIENSNPVSNWPPINSLEATILAYNICKTVETNRKSHSSDSSIQESFHNSRRQIFESIESALETEIGMRIACFQLLDTLSVDVDEKVSSENNFELSDDLKFVKLVTIIQRISRKWIKDEEIKLTKADIYSIETKSKLFLRVFKLITKNSFDGSVVGIVLDLLQLLICLESFSNVKKDENKLQFKTCWIDLFEWVIDISEKSKEDSSSLQFQGIELIQQQIMNQHSNQKRIKEEYIRTLVSGNSGWNHLESSTRLPLLVWRCISPNYLEKLEQISIINKINLKNKLLSLIIQLLSEFEEIRNIGIKFLLFGNSTPPVSVCYSDNNLNSFGGSKFLNQFQLSPFGFSQVALTETKLSKDLKNYLKNREIMGLLLSNKSILEVVIHSSFHRKLIFSSIISLSNPILTEWIVTLLSESQLYSYAGLLLISLNQNYSIVSSVDGLLWTVKQYLTQIRTNKLTGSQISDKQINKVLEKLEHIIQVGELR
eukprot:c13876_g1_i3.p1 GENE.c13876_g1_i3~~c13876_g1_i3.p1  ORF type:complete len:495 (-),score=141.72 c13876_g1_i3:23-1507(-)